MRNSQVHPYYQRSWDGCAPDASSTPMPGSDFNDYLVALARVGAWGSHLEIRAFAAAYHTPVVLFRSHKPPVHFPVLKKPRIPICLYFDASARHYSAVSGDPMSFIMHLGGASSCGGRGGMHPRPLSWPRAPIRHRSLAHFLDRQFDLPLIRQAASFLGLSIPEEWELTFRDPTSGLSFHPAVEWVFHAQLCSDNIEPTLVRLFDYWHPYYLSFPSATKQLGHVGGY